MNQRNITDIRGLCDDNNIHIISIREHLTPDYLTGGIIRLCMERFIVEYYKTYIQYTHNCHSKLIESIDVKETFEGETVRFSRKGVKSGNYS